LLRTVHRWVAGVWWVGHAAAEDSGRGDREDRGGPGAARGGAQQPAWFVAGGEPEPERGVGEGVGVHAEERLGVATAGELAVEQIRAEGDDREPSARCCDGGQVAANKGDGVGGAEGAPGSEQAQVGGGERPAGHDPPRATGTTEDERAVQRSGLGERPGPRSRLLHGAPAGAPKEPDPGPGPPPVTAQPREQVVGGRPALSDIDRHVPRIPHERLPSAPARLAAPPNFTSARSRLPDRLGCSLVIATSLAP
jgi:hypothetical protein